MGVFTTKLSCLEPTSQPQAWRNGVGLQPKSLSLKGSIAEPAQHVHPLSRLHTCTLDTHTQRVETGNLSRGDEGPVNQDDSRFKTS